MEGRWSLFGLLLAALIASCAAQDLDCDFEKDFCAWTQPPTAKRDWARGQGKSVTPGTGPSSDHTTGTGYYAYLETSLGFQGDDVLLQSPKVTLAGTSCLSFYYHMYGPHVATLTLYSVSNAGVRTSLWTRKGTQGDQWLRAQVDIPKGTDFQLLFEAVKGTLNKGDIAIDDVTYTKTGDCASSVTVAPPSVKPGQSTPPPSALTCDFERGDLCGYQRTTGLNHKMWAWATAATASSNKGPDKDHSYNTPQGHYVFIDARTGSAFLTTNNVPADTDRCLRFWFSFGGSDAGTLNVYTETTGRGQALWTLGSWSGFGWNVAEVNLPAGPTSYK
ncbi:hypothetical protein EGW08_022349, partial [Elysia chlorotica]